MKYKILIHEDKKFKYAICKFSNGSIEVISLKKTNDY